jgi:hypothetical protein
MDQYRFAGDYFSKVIDVVDYFIMEMSYQADFNNHVTQLTNNLQVSVKNFNLFCHSNFLFLPLPTAILFESTLGGVKK